VTDAVAEDNDSIFSRKVKDMKRTSTMMTLIITGVVLLAALGVGLGIRGVRSRRAAEVERNREMARRREMPGYGGRAGTRELSTEDRARRREQREGMRERMANMSEEEREEFRAQMRERFGADPRGGRQRFRDLTPEQREKLAEQRAKMMEGWENMSEEEREKIKAQMRERFSGISPEGGARREEEAENAVQEQNSVPEK